MFSLRTFQRVCLVAALVVLAVGNYRDWSPTLIYGLMAMFLGIDVVLMMGELAPDLWR